MVENVFGILTARWRILRRQITLLQENVNAELSQCHNYMQRGDGHRIGHEHSVAPHGK